MRLNNFPLFVRQVNNNLLTRTRKRGNASLLSIFEENQYDIFGNITKKTISNGSGAIGQRTTPSLENSNDSMGALIAPENPLAPRITNYAYNPAPPFNGRFMTSSTNIDGLITTYDYNPSYGTLLSETKPFNLITTHFYDRWFRRLATADYLGNNASVNFVRDGNNTKRTTLAGAGGVAPTEEIYNDLGLKIKSGAKNIDGNWVYISYLYNLDDKLTKTSEPYFGTTPSLWNETVYDSYGRVKSTTDFRSKTTNISYSGLTTTINDGTLEKTSIKSSFGSIISTTDNPGGTISNKYFANGNLKSTTYDNGGTTTITQDNWGRKKTLTDPSAGSFSYTYNLYGEILTETNPNGTSTYVYDNFGKLLTKRIIGSNGDNTLTTNTYDTTTKLITATIYNDITEGLTTNYTFGYDNYKRPNYYDESSTKAYFQRATQYDSFGRPSNQLYTAINASNTSQTSSKWTCNVYKNGYLHQLKDGFNGAGVVFYQTNSLNAKGQMLTAQMANGVTIANEYDTYGFPTKMQHDKGITNIMTLNNTFDNVRGNLKTRDNNLFGTGANLWSEDFTNRLDNNDRLTGYKDHTGNYVTQTYNANGTINTNAVGTNTYNSAKPFQASFIPVTNPSPVYSYYNSRAQTIVYNAIKKPISIVEVGQENINFDHNINGQRSTMYYGNTNPDKNLRTYIKSYSADGSMELRRNTITNSIEFITYLGGDAYSAPLMLKTDGTTYTLQNFLYLHRDYQGSILAITNNVGVVQEKRLFDAWGSLINFWSPTSNTVPTTAGIMITDRGYTGHEHLLGVGLINMNGRLYDNAFHRFLSSDNNLQEPSNTQNYNRYGYCLNNPFKYTDENGEFFSLLVGLIQGIYNIATHGVNFDNYNWDKTRNAWRIDSGWFEGNGNQITSRFGGELPQSFSGWLYGHFINIAGKVDNVQFYEGATVIKTYGDKLPFTSKANGVTLGSFIIGNNKIEAVANNQLFMHEYGHYLQSQATGLSYLSAYAFPSVYGFSDVEEDANSRAIRYFYNKIGTNLKWDFDTFKIDGSSNWRISEYNTQNFQLALSNSLVSPSWLDTTLGVFLPFLTGLFH